MNNGRVEVILKTPQNISFAPGIHVRDIHRSFEFYAGVLGFRITGAITRNDGTIVRAFVGPNSPLLMLLPAEYQQGSEKGNEMAQNKPGVGVEFCIGLTGEKALEEFLAEVKTKGAIVLNEPAIGSWGDRVFSIKDPDGYVLTFFESVDGIVAQDAMGPIYLCGEHVSGRGRQISAPGQAIPWRNDCAFSKGVIVREPATVSGLYTVLDEETFSLIEVKEEHLRLLS